MSVFDLIVSTQLVAYWEEMTADRAPYMTEELFPVEQKLGLKIDWITGNKGTPKVLKLSAFDAKAIPRLRNKLDKLEAQMPFFKESFERAVNQYTAQSFYDTLFFFACVESVIVGYVLEVYLNETVGKQFHYCLHFVG